MLHAPVDQEPVVGSPLAKANRDPWRVRQAQAKAPRGQTSSPTAKDAEIEVIEPVQRAEAEAIQRTAE